MEIRRATPTDASGLLEIYRPIVEETTISFEIVAPTKQEFATRIESTLKHHEWLVMDSANGLCGYAYALPHRHRAAYQSSVETSVYVHPDYRCQGIGKKLYLALFASLGRLDFHNAYAAIALPNDASITFHKALGFESIGIFREVGFKHGAWHDVSWWQRRVDVQLDNPER